MKTAAILEKRTSESIGYDINCSQLLNSAETISGSISISSDTTGLTFGLPVANSQVIAYDDGSTAAIGKVVQVRISAGTIPTGKTERIYTLRVLFSTSDGNTREATVLLKVTNEAS